MMGSGELLLAKLDVVKHSDSYGTVMLDDITLLAYICSTNTLYQLSELYNAPM